MRFLCLRSTAQCKVTVPNVENPSNQGSDNHYEVEITADNGTNSTARTITVTVTDNPADNVLDFSGSEEAVAVIFPNPSGHYLGVRSSMGGTFKILSLSGKPLLKSAANRGVDIISLQSGLYLVQLLDGGLLKFIRE